MQSSTTRVRHAPATRNGRRTAYLSLARPGVVAGSQRVQSDEGSLVSGLLCSASTCPPILVGVAWWRRTKARPDADELLRQVQDARARLAEAEADIRRQAVRGDGISADPRRASDPSLEPWDSDQE